MNLNEKEMNIYNVINDVVHDRKTRKEACFELHKSRQQIYRLILKYNSEGQNGFIHKNRGRKSINKADNKLVDDLEHLYLTEYYDYNLEAFYEELVEKYNYNVSYQFVLKQFKKDDIISPLAHKMTVKSYNEKLSNVLNSNEEIISKEKLELYKSRIIEVEKAHVRRSSNLYAFGQEVQMDACQKLWFGGIASYLHLAVDKGTKKVLFGWFEYEEITRGYFVLLFHIIINYGIPFKIKADNRSSFSANNAKDKSAKHFLTQFGKVCETLNIALETTSVAAAKANVERENGTFKNRLIAELRHENIITINEANDYLNNIFIPKMNAKFSYVIDEQTSKMRKNNYTIEELNLIISEKNTRIIDNASCIRYDKNYYIPVSPTTGEIITFSKGTECIFILTYNGDYWCKIENHYYQLLELKDRSSIMTKENEIIQPEQKEKHQYIPPANHPWRKNMMLKHR